MHLVFKYINYLLNLKSKLFFIKKTEESSKLGKLA